MMVRVADEDKEEEERDEYQSGKSGVWGGEIHEYLRKRVLIKGGHYNKIFGNIRETE